MNNSTISIGTESQYSPFSHQRLDENDFKQEGGSIFSFLFGSEKGTYATELALKAFNDKIPQISCYIIKDSLDKNNKIALDFTKQDCHGKTLLHYLVLYSAYFPDAKQLFIDIFDHDCTNAKKALNLQDLKKNTCLHYAMYLELDDVVKYLADFGADLSIKNNDGLYIKLEQEPVKTAPSDIFVQISSNVIQSPKKLNPKSVNSDTVEARLNSIVQAFVNAKNRDSDIDTIGFKNDNITESDVNYNTRNQNNKENNKENDTDKIMNSILDRFETFKPNNGANYGINNNADQIGGKKKDKKSTQHKKNGKVTGKRKMVTYSEMSFGGASSTDVSEIEEEDSEFDNAKLRDIARAINNKASEAHANAILRIKEILKIEDEEARAVKAILYDKIKKEKSELTNLDKAVELEKMASDKSVLKAITKSSIKKMVELIKQRHSDKENSNASSEQSTKSSKKRKQSRLLSYESDTDDSSSSSSSEMERKSKKILEITDDSSSTTSSSEA